MTIEYIFIGIFCGYYGIFCSILAYTIYKERQLKLQRQLLIEQTTNEQSFELNNHYEQSYELKEQLDTIYEI